MQSTKFSILLFCVFALFSTVVNAQRKPISGEFVGEWIFQSAETKIDGKAIKISSIEEFYSHHDFRPIPVEIEIVNTYQAFVTNDFFKRRSVIVSVEYDDANVDFREGDVPEDFNVETSRWLEVADNPIFPPVFDYLQKPDDNTVKVQASCLYYNKTSGKYTDIVVVVYYRAK